MSDSAPTPKHPPPPVPFWSLFFAVLRKPREALAGVADRANLREAIAAMLFLGVFHAIFSLVLHLGGHTPRMGIPGLPRDNHYLWQALFIIPLYLGLFWIGGLVSHILARASANTGSRNASLAVFGVAYAVPMITLFLLPDVIVYLALGFAAIGKAMRWYAPIAAITCVWLGALGLSHVHAIGKGRAILAAFIGFVVQAMIGGAFLR